MLGMIWGTRMGKLRPCMLTPVNVGYWAAMCARVRACLKWMDVALTWVLLGFSCIVLLCHVPQV